MAGRMRAVFVRRQFPIAVFIELQQRSGGVCDLTCINNAIPVGVQRRDNRRDPSFSIGSLRRRRGVGAARRDRHVFIGRELPVAILVQFLQRRRCVGDFFRVNDTIPIGIQHGDNRERRRTMMAVGRRRIAILIGRRAIGRLRDKV